VTEREQLRRWVENWKETGPLLEAIRREEVKAADNVRSLALLESAFNHALSLPARESSGLVEMQAQFLKLRR